MLRSFISLVVIASLISSCATIRSRDLSPNGVNPRIEGEQFFRGESETLDEQEFYQLVGDKESYEAIRGPRVSAQSSQFIWGTLAVIGLGAAGFGAANVMLPVGGPLGDQGLFQPLFPSELNFLTYAITVAGAVLFGTGIALATGAAKRVNPEERMFDITHAIQSAQRAGIDATLPAPGTEAYRQAMEKKKADEEYDRLQARRAALTVKDIAKLQLTVEDDKTTYCDVGRVRVKYLAANGEELDFPSGKEFHEFTSDPPESIDAAGRFYSPLNKELKYLGVPLVIRAKVPETGVSAELTLQQDLSCRKALLLEGGRSGSSGQKGENGRDGDSSHLNGTAGGNGGSGSNASSRTAALEAEAAFIKDRAGQSYLLLVGKDEEDEDGLDWEVIDGDGVITGRGGSGGTGGKGGDGGKGYIAYRDCDVPGDGGNGGNGGNGGDGGPGPDLKVRVASAAVRKRVKVQSVGGMPGRGGEGGSGGSVVTQYCSSARETFRGVRGRDGVAGVASGRAGSAGDVDVDIVPAAKLKLVQKLLKSAPGLRLDDDGLDDPAKKR